MSKWIYDGYTKIRVGHGRHARYIETHTYICPDCNWHERIERTVKPPEFCPVCGKNMKDGEQE